MLKYHQVTVMMMNKVLQQAKHPIQWPSGNVDKSCKPLRHLSGIRPGLIKSGLKVRFSYFETSCSFHCDVEQNNSVSFLVLYGQNYSPPLLLKYHCFIKTNCITCSNLCCWSVPYSVHEPGNMWLWVISIMPGHYTQSC